MFSLNWIHRKHIQSYAVLRFSLGQVKVSARLAQSLLLYLHIYQCIHLYFYFLENSSERIIIFDDFESSAGGCQIFLSEVYHQHQSLPTVLCCWIYFSDSLSCISLYLKDIFLWNVNLNRFFSARFTSSLSPEGNQSQSYDHSRFEHKHDKLGSTHSHNFTSLIFTI